MTQEWPGQWHSKVTEDKPAGSVVNDHGTLYLVEGGDFLYMYDIPDHLENRC